MSRIKICCASAGSGKTTWIAKELAEGLAAGSVRPEAVLATTFTIKAAAELQERGRVRLLKGKRPAEAAQLNAARIGTVNAVCSKLVKDFAFSLGLSPRLTVLDESSAGAALKAAISTVLEAAESQQLAVLSNRMEDFGWQDSVERVASFARSNCIPGESLAGCAARSEAELIKLFGAPAPDGEALDRALAAGIEHFQQSVDRTADGTKATAAALERAEASLQRLRQDGFLPWKDWLGLAALGVGKKSEAAAAPLKEAAAQQDCHPLLLADVRAAIRLVYDLAAKSLDAYAAYKKAQGVIDFIDQEFYALELLRMPEVQEQLRGQLDLLLVDELQDTSPIQLAIFLALDRLSRQSIWVGDQKQAIYGFRGADPSLMDAAIDGILSGGEPVQLLKSYRSRPALVRLTSEVFAPAFAAYGIPAERVRLEPELTVEPAGLGPILEHWALSTKNKEDDAAALASAMRKFLSDGVKVRDRGTGKPRGVQPGDVAVLCRTNATCISVANALGEQNIRTALAQTGLFSTLEARTVLAGLRLWVDEKDSLAAAELARVLPYAGKPEEWLKKAFEHHENEEAFKGLPGAKEVLESRKGHPRHGALATFDEVTEALDMRKLCHGWGNAGSRLSNLDAMRAHAFAYAVSCRENGTGCSPSGLVSRFAELAGSEGDTQGIILEGDAVTVSTWHGAKGLEWPVTVLFELDSRERAKSALGAHMLSDREKIDLDDPLGGRWIRYWPEPYSARNTKGPFYDRLRDRPASQQEDRRTAFEALRLLYVGWTRARDRVVLASREGKLLEGTLALLKNGDEQLLSEPNGESVAWAGQEVPIVIRRADREAAMVSDPAAGEDYVSAGPKAYPPAVINPSEAQEPAATAGAAGPPAQTARGERLVRTIGVRAKVTASSDEQWTTLGTAIHIFLCADRAGLGAPERLALAKEILVRWGAPGWIEPADMVQAGTALKDWIDREWPGAVWHREWPLLHRLSSGSVVRGTADLVLELPAGFVLIDHKSFPGSREQAEKRAASFAGQLELYSQGITAAKGWTLLSAWIHLPVSGFAVRIFPD